MHFGSISAQYFQLPQQLFTSYVTVHYKRLDPDHFFDFHSAQRHSGTKLEFETWSVP